MMADLRQIPAADQPALLSDAVRSAALVDHLTRPIGQLSKGFRQRVGLAQAILHKPQLLILDEPTIGLDPTQIVEVRRLVRRLARRSTVLLSTHILSEVEATCDRVIILLNGEVRSDARLAELSAAVDVILVLQEGTSDVTDDLKGLHGVQAVEATRTADGPAYRIRGTNGADLRPGIYELAREQDWPLRELRRDVRTLETIFNELATAAAVEASQGSTQGGDES
jgi:ABC-2 type transport system ATP-binding protein